MHPESRIHRGKSIGLAALLASLACASSACGDDDAAADTSSGAGPGASTGVSGAGGGTSSTESTGTDGSGAGTQHVPPMSPTALVKFRTGQRLEADVAKALGLAREEVCNELGAFNCRSLHQVSLLEPDAFAGLYQPLPETTATTPLAVERIVLSACDAAVRRDIEAGDDAVVWRELDIDAAGALVDPDGDAASESVTRLIRQALLREPTGEELVAHRDLYDDIAAAAATTAPAREWAVLGCFATFTSLEFLFY